MNRRAALITAMVILFVGVVVSQPALGEQSWWDAQWDLKRELRINNTGGVDLSYYQVFVNLTGMSVDAQSLRVVNETAGTTVPHWNESVDANGYVTHLWFNCTHIPADSWLNETYYIYYGNDGASSTSEGEDTFVFFDDFEDSNYTDKWTAVKQPAASDVVESSGTLQITDDASGSEWIETFVYHLLSSPTEGYLVGVKIKGSSLSGFQYGVAITSCYSGSAPSACSEYLWLREINGGYEMLTDAGNPTISGTSKVNVYDTFRIWYDGADYNGEIVGKGSNTVASTNKPTYLWLTCSENGGTYTATFDDVFVRKYTDPDPVVVVGGSEAGPNLIIPLTPTNNQIVNGTFPPMLYPINFTWSKGNTSAYEIRVAEDPMFNLIEVDAHVGTNYTVVYLEDGKHYWKVRSYNQETEEYGNWSYTFNLTLNLQTSTDGSTGIHGVVYADNDNDIDGAYVTIWNDTWTSGMTTGSNGYYLFTGLDNESTYSLQAVKDGYEESNVELVTPTVNEWTEKNIYLLLCTSALECFYNSHFVRLTYYDSYWTANPVQGLTVKVYEGTSTDVKYQSTTDHTGSVVFLLVKNQEYTITFTGQGVSDSYTITPSEDNYQFYGSGEVGEWDKDEHDIIEDINISVWTSTINATHAKIHVYYNDTLNMTNEVVVYLNQTNTSDYQNQTLLDTYTASSSEFTWTPTVSDYRGQSYHIRFDVNHGEFSEFMRDYGVRFKGILVDLGWSEPVYLLFAVGLMLFVGAIFTATSVEVGSMVVVMLGWIFYFIGWLNYIPSSKILIGLIFATVVALAANMAIKTQREGIG